MHILGPSDRPDSPLGAGMGLNQHHVPGAVLGRFVSLFLSAAWGGRSVSGLLARLPVDITGTGWAPAVALALGTAAGFWSGVVRVPPPE